MSTDKPLTPNTCLPTGTASQIYRHGPKHFRDELQNLLYLDNQVFIFDFE